MLPLRRAEAGFVGQNRTEIGHEKVAYFAHFEGFHPKLPAKTLVIWAKQRQSAQIHENSQ